MPNLNGVWALRSEVSSHQHKKYGGQDHTTILNWRALTYLSSLSKDKLAGQGEKIICNANKQERKSSWLSYRKSKGHCFNCHSPKCFSQSLYTILQILHCEICLTYNNENDKKHKLRKLF